MSEYEWERSPEAQRHLAVCRGTGMEPLAMESMSKPDQHDDTSGIINSE